MKMKDVETTRQKGLNWILERLNDDGSFKAARPLLSCYPKAPFALMKSGRNEEAMRILDWIKNNCFTDDGDFRACDEYKIEPSTDSFEWRLYLYHNAWFCLSALLNGRFDISKPGIDFMLSHQCETRGGFYSNMIGGDYKGFTDIASTSSACQVLTYLGNEAVLLRAADYLIKTFDAQKNEDLFYLYMNENGELVEELPNQNPTHYIVNSTKSPQNFWMVGISAAILALTYRLTRTQKYLDTSKKYIEFLLRCPDDAFASFGCWKQGWACCLLYTITGESLYKNKATGVIDYLIEYQDADGAWKFNKDLGMPEEDDSIVFNMTSEMLLWFQDLPRYLV